MPKFSALSAMALLSFTLALGGCQGITNGSNSGGPPPPVQTLQSSVNHIIFMAQENRSFDHYFGQLPAYWQANGYPSQAFDGLPADASNPSYDMLSTVNAFHLATECVQNLSPFWNESHVDYNRQDPLSATAALDGFVQTAANYALNAPPDEAPIYDTLGIRSMGYYDGTDLNYYYFMASNFATSDKWFSPVMTRTQPNRLYLLAATSAGNVYPPTATLSVPTIFQLLDNAGITWKIYETEPGTTYLNNFQPYATDHAANIVPIADYTTDAQNGTLPAVAMIEGGYNTGLDEHPKNNLQTGAAYVEGLINTLMTSQSWKDSVFILTYDEAGGFYDHVAPMPTVSPDGIPPAGLQPTDICATTTGPTCDFTYTGYRVPLIVISPFTKKNFVSHTPADYTAILKLIETRYTLPSLTARDAAQPDMTEFFDFQNPPWLTPPTPPAQATGGLCDYQTLQ